MELRKLLEESWKQEAGFKVKCLMNDGPLEGAGRSCRRS